jgi:hypothetical protein
LEADYRELESCMKAGAWKAVHVLAGSVIEAVLIDYLTATGYQAKTSIDPLKMDLAQAIAACQKEGVLTEKTEQLSSAIKSYRNLIHPGRQIRLGEEIDENGARVAQALVDIVLKEISARRRQNYGYTALQIVSKLERDSSALAILEHLLKSMNSSELEQLLLRAIPERYMATQADWGGQEFLESLVRCFHLAFDIAPHEIKGKVAKRFVAILKEEGEELVLTYESRFFRGSDLRYLSSEEAALVKQHILSRLSESVGVSILRAVEGLGAFLAPNEVGGFVDAMVRTIIWGKTDLLKKNARERIESVYWELNEDVRKGMMKRLDDWIAHLRDKGQAEFAETVEEMKAFFDVVPF